MKSTELAYWIGVAQTDGFLKKVYDKKKRVTRHYAAFHIGLKSLLMLRKFREISQQVFGIQGTTFHDKKRPAIEYKFGCKRVEHLFPVLDIDSQKRHTLTLRSESVSVSGRPPPHKDTPTFMLRKHSFLAS